MLLYVYLCFSLFCCCFSSKNLHFYHFHFFFYDKVSNFRNRILTNQKLELLKRNCQWKRMNMPVGSNFSSSNLKMGELMSRLPMITSLIFSVLITLNRDTQPKSTTAVLLQLFIISSCCIVSLISILKFESFDY